MEGSQEIKSDTAAAKSFSDLIRDDFMLKTFNVENLSYTNIAEINKYVDNCKNAFAVLEKFKKKIMQDADYIDSIDREMQQFDKDIARAADKKAAINGYTYEPGEADRNPLGSPMNNFQNYTGQFEGKKPGTGLMGSAGQTTISPADPQK